MESVAAVSKWAAGLTAAVLTFGSALEAHAQQDRAAFAKAMAEVKEGMPSAEVAQILGEPDDIRTENDPGGISTARSEVIWCYGTDGHLTFPTLGCVYIDTKDRAQYVYGGSGSPPDSSLFSEAELRSLLRLIDRAPGLYGKRYDPLDVIRIVNRLHPLGKEKALAALDEYLRVASQFESDAREGLFLVLRVLFEIPEDPGFMPVMRVGAPGPAAPIDPKLLPRFPIVLMDDIPLMLVYGYLLAGSPEPVERHAEYFRTHGVLREKLLHPTGDPLAVLEKLEDSPRWIYDSEKNARERAQSFLRNQLLRLVQPVYRLEPDQFAGLQPEATIDDKEWEKIRGEFSALEIKWDPENNTYTFKDGTTLPEIEKKIHRREIWKPASLGAGTRLILERANPSYVHVIFTRYDSDKAPGAKLILRRHPITSETKPVAELAIEEDFSGYMSTSGPLEEGESVVVELRIRGKTTESPVYTP